MVSLLVETQELSLAGKLSEADSLVEEMIRRWPDDATGYYSRAIQRRVRTSGCIGRTPEDDLFADVDTAINRARARIEKDPDDDWSRYMLALSLGMDAAIKAQYGHLWSAWRTSERSLDRFEEVRERAPRFEDIWLPLGTYHFWRGEVLKNWAWLPFIDDTREQGLTEVRHAVSHGSLTRSSGYNVLAWTLVHGGHYDEAVTLTDSMLSIYPDARTFRWSRAEALLGAGRWEEARDAFQWVAESFDPGDHGCAGWVTVRAKRAMALVELGDCAGAREDLRRVPAFSPTEPYRRRFDELREQAETYLKRCDDAAANEGAGE